MRLLAPTISVGLVKRRSLLGNPTELCQSKQNCVYCGHKMMQKNRFDSVQSSRNLAYAIDKTQAQWREMSFEKALISFRSIESIFLPAYERKPKLFIETKRRIAEAIFDAAIVRKMPFPVCRRLFKNLCRLGFTNIERKSTFYLFYGYVCSRTGHPRAGIRLLQELEKELQKTLRSKPNNWFRRELEFVRTLLEELKMQQRSGGKLS
jgi:hypothetical protein